MKKTIFDGRSHHSIEHLAPFSFTYSRPAKDTEPAWDKEIAVTFSWHCYTRTPEAGEHVYLVRDGNEQRCFCPTRYLLSQYLPGIIRQLDQKAIFQTGKGNFVTIEVLDPAGGSTEYGIFFTITRGKNKDPLKLRVSSAYPFLEPEKRYQVSRQRIRFNIIVYNTVQGKPIKFKR